MTFSVFVRGELYTRPKLELYLFLPTRPTLSKKLPLPKKFYCNFNFSYKIFFFIMVNYREANVYINNPGRRHAHVL